MYLEQVLGSEARIKVLRSLFHGQRALDAQALVAETGKSRAGVYKALRELAATGLLVEERRGRIAFYALASAHPLFDALAAVFHAEAHRQPVAHLTPAFWSHLEGWVAQLARVPSVKFALLFGSVLRPPLYPGSDVDVLLVVDDPQALPLWESMILGHPLSVTPMRVDTYWTRRRQNDPFLASVLERHVVLHRSPEYVYPGQRAPEAPRGGTPPGSRAG